MARIGWDVNKSVAYVTSLCLLLLTAKNFFRVSFRSGGQLQSHCFQASDAFNKQQWINCIKQAKEAAALSGEQTAQTGPSVETELRLCGDSELEPERGNWGEAESGMGPDPEESLGLTPETGREMEEVEVETGKEEETDAGVDMEAEQGVKDETGAKEKSQVEEDHPPQEEKEVMEEEEKHAEEEEESGMETSEEEEELSFRC